MNKLAVFSFTGNLAESRMVAKTTEIHFDRLIGRNLYAIKDMGKDFDPNTGASFFEGLAATNQQLDDELSFAVVCEYPTANILELMETLVKVWGSDRARLYIRVSEDLSVHPLIYSYTTLTLDAASIIADLDGVANTHILGNVLAKRNCYDEYVVALPKTINVLEVLETETADITERLGKLFAMLQIKPVINFTYRDLDLEEAVANKESDRQAAQLAEIDQGVQP